VTASEIILVRHAEPIPAHPASADASDDDRPLSEAGLLAAQSLAATLAHLPITAVFSSPHRRAIETIGPIAAARGLDVRVDDDLRERRLADTHLTGEEFVEALRRARKDSGFRLPGGETTDEVLQRALRACRRMTNSASDGIALAGTHGGVISIMRWSLGEDFSVEDALREPMPALYRFAPFVEDSDHLR
jgi:2,3-bisphosphoglycerate-dependent phosphoglycerate mutase